MSSEFKSIDYTSRETSTIYNNLLEIRPYLSKVWTSEDDTDPGIVLLKLMSSVADMLSFSIDMNANESFPATVTEWRNAYKIYRPLGYKMKWYRSSRCNIHITLPSSVLSSTELIIIPKGTEFLTDSGIVFTSLSSVTFNPTVSSPNLVLNIPCIQGYLSSTNYSPSSVSSDGKLYINNARVDESIIELSMEDTESSTSSWTYVSDELKSLFTNNIFDFNIDDNGYPYLQLGNFSSTTLEKTSTILVNTYVSLGSNGTISENTITNSNQLVYQGDTSVAVTYSNDASIGGYNPESVASAYTNALKSISKMSSIISKNDLVSTVTDLTISLPVLIPNALTLDSTDSLYTIDSNYNYDSTSSTNLPYGEVVCKLAIDPKTYSGFSDLVTEVESLVTQYTMINVHVNYQLAEYFNNDLSFHVYTNNSQSYTSELRNFVGVNELPASATSGVNYYYVYSTKLFHSVSGTSISSTGESLSTNSSSVFLNIVSLLESYYYQSNRSFGETIKVINIIQYLSNNLSDLSYIDLIGSTIVITPTGGDIFKLPQLGSLSISIN